MKSLAVNMIVWNGETLIERSLRAVLPFVKEAHVTDTGSTDKTMEILTNLQKEYPYLEVARNDVSGLGDFWTFSERDSALTVMLNLMKKKTKAEWILRVDDDEIFPDFLMQEIIDMEPKEDYYVIYWHHITKDKPKMTYKPYYFRHSRVLRLFKNTPELSWSGFYGRETISRGTYRIPTRRCNALKNRFIHLGEFRSRYEALKEKHGYDHIYGETYKKFGEDVFMPLPEEYKKYINEL